MKKSSIICVTSASLLLMVGMGALLVLPWVLVKIVHSKLVLSPESESFGLWRDLPVPMFQKFYFFNVTNPHEVQTLGHTPRLQEVGPFVYRLEVKKYDLNFTNSGQSVYFRENFAYHFDRDLSVDDLSLKITTLNTPLAIALKFAEPLNFFMRTASMILIDTLNEKFFIEKTVGELIFDGYPDLLTKLAPMLNPKIPYFPSFGWMYNRNETNDGLFSVNSGRNDISLVNAIESLDGSPELSFWSSSECNSVKGAKNGELFNPIDSTADSLSFFRTDLCRVWQMVYNSTKKSRFGDLSVYHYFPSDNTFDNSSEYPPNSCYKPNENLTKHLDIEEFSVNSFMKKLEDLLGNHSQVFDKLFSTLEETMLELELTSNKSGQWTPRVADFVEYPSGIFEMSPCHYTAPIFISNPHFLDADPYYLTTVSGLKPNASMHQTFLDVEPITGIPIELELRVQINVHIEPFADRFKQYRKMPRIHFPVLWQEFSIHVTDEIANKLHWELTGPSLIAMVISSLFIAIGALTLVVVASKPVRKWCSMRGSSHPEDCDRSALIDDTINHNGNEPIVA